MKVSGSKTELIKRLKEHDESSSKPLDEDSMMFHGLCVFQFGTERQGRVKKETNVDRFKSHYGIPPKTALAVYEGLRGKHTFVELKYFLMTLNWIKLYKTETQLSGPWGYCEDHVRAKCKEYAKMIQSLKEDKIVFDGFEEDEIHWITVDTVNFLAQVSSTHSQILVYRELTIIPPTAGIPTRPIGT